MPKMTITGRGQVTFRKEILQHLGLRPGDKVELDLLPGGEATIRAARPTGTIDDFIGLLAGKTDKILSIEQISEAISAGWAGQN